jgi:hypothetical protein
VFYLAILLWENTLLLAEAYGETDVPFRSVDKKSISIDFSGIKLASVAKVAAGIQHPTLPKLLIRAKLHFHI